MELVVCKYLFGFWTRLVKTNVRYFLFKWYIKKIIQYISLSIPLTKSRMYVPPGIQYQSGADILWDFPQAAS